MNLLSPDDLGYVVIADTQDHARMVSESIEGIGIEVANASILSEDSQVTLIDRSIDKELM